jgi:phage/plasmid-associated DNA primase
MPSPSSDPKRSPLADPAAITRSVKDQLGKDATSPRTNSGAEEPGSTSGDAGGPNDRFRGFRDTSQAGRGEKSRPGQSRFRRPTWPGPSDQPTARRPRQAQIDKEESEGKGPDGEDPEWDESAAGSTKTEDTSGEEPAPEEEATGEDATEGESTEKSLEERWKSVREDYREGNRKQARGSAADLAREEHAFVTVRLGEELYVLDPSTMTYHPGGPQALKELLAERLGPHFSRREAREIKARIKAATYVGGLGPARAIPLANGDLQARPLALLDFDSNRRFQVRTKAQHDPEARCPAFKSFLRDAVPFGRQVLQDYVGYCLLHWARPYRRALLLVGPNGGGQEVVLCALQMIVPWCASVRPAHLVQKASGTTQLKGPWVNACAEVDPEALTGFPLLRSFGAGTPRYSDPEQIQEARQGPSPRRVAKHIYTASDLPPLSAGDPFFRRILLGCFPETLSPSEIPTPEELRAERDGILQWALEGLKRVLDSHASGSGFPSGRGLEMTRRLWEDFSAPIGRFKAARLEVTGDAQDVVPKDIVHPAYERFCDKEGVLAEKKNKLTRTLTDDPRIDKAPRTPDSHADQVPCYVGVRMRDR